ncbi:S8/S53 family peptidase [Gloeocapsa sp. PCC 73106]|uniref:S8 family peptidase n=1 Tax=Gloeocapsa sp. PCC 73106 TaxID=102232 RepID=UPI0002AC3514|nr:S8/S53 family peptidase [Gloeocapsa sp. PCC 73106]ELR98724.1 subtilisin-like serine protease [Gloeocapsa sp. PCC 73106]
MSTNTIRHDIQEPVYIQGEPDTQISITGGLGTASSSLMNLDTFKTQFPTIDGRGSAVVVIDTGINLQHSAFGNRIVYNYDFGDNDNDASDSNGHGTNVSSIIASSNSSYPGVAEGVDIIHLKIFTNGGTATTAKLEQALRWVIDHSANNPNAVAPTFNITAINMSLSDSKNWNTYVQPVGIHDELNVLANELNIIPVSAAGNFFNNYLSQQGVGYPAADRNSLAVSAVFDRNVGSTTYWGATSSISGPDLVSGFTQRHGTLTTVMAPGVQILGAGRTGQGTSVFTGTSQAAPQVTGVVVLAQQLAQQTLGRRLTFNEMTNLLQNTGRRVNDGDDEVDNVSNTNLNFQRVDVMALAQSILNMAPPPPPVSNRLNVTIGQTSYNAEIAEYGSGQGIANIGNYTASVENQNQLNITGNTWMRLPINYNITPNTVLEFDFRSTNRGDIHGIGFDTDNRYSYNPDAGRGFKLYGTETWGISGNNYTNVGNWQNFRIAVGSTFTGNFSQLVFANDHDISSPTATGSYRNIRFYENASENLRINVGGTSQTAEVRGYGSGSGIANIGTYTASVQNETQLDITGNAWLRVPIDYTVTANTVLRFDFRSTNRGEIHGIGLDADNRYSYTPDSRNGFKLYGTEWWGVQGNNYTNVGNWQTFQINLGQYQSLTGNNFRNLSFVNDHDVASPTAMSSFNNIELFER